MENDHLASVILSNGEEIVHTYVSSIAVTPSGALVISKMGIKNKKPYEHIIAAYNQNTWNDVMLQELVER